MTAHRGAMAWDHDYRAVIVGLDRRTNNVQRVYIRKDGFIVCGEHSHFPLERMAIAEAVMVFGIRQPREFSIANEAKADAYAEELRCSVLASNGSDSSLTYLARRPRSADVFVGREAAEGLGPAG